MVPDKWLTERQLKARGWNEELISFFLETPDVSSGGKRYSFRRVLAEEETFAFKSQVQLAPSISYETLYDRAVQVLENWHPTILREDFKSVWKKAILHYVEHSPKPIVIETTTPKYFLLRLTYNYIRHEVSDYDRVRKEVRRLVGPTVLYMELREKLDKVILEVYPELQSAVEESLQRSSRIPLK